MGNILSEYFINIEILDTISYNPGYDILEIFEKFRILELIWKKLLKDLFALKSRIKIFSPRLSG